MASRQESKSSILVQLAIIPIFVDVLAISLIYALALAFLSGVLDWIIDIWPGIIATPLLQIHSTSPTDAINRLIAVLLPIWLVVSILASIVVHIRALIAGRKETPDG